MHKSVSSNITNLDANPLLVIYYGEIFLFKIGPKKRKIQKFKKEISIIFANNAYTSHES